MKQTWNELIIRASSIERTRTVYGDDVAEAEILRRKARHLPRRDRGPDQAPRRTHDGGSSR